MFRHLLNAHQRTHNVTPVDGQADWSLQIVLWTLWTLSIVVVGYINWHTAATTHHPLNIPGLAIHCALTGAVGLVVLTIIEMRIEPWRFYDE